MANIAYKRKYHIHESIGAATASEFYMISDPESGCGLAAVEEKAGLGKIAAKFFLDKALLSVQLEMLSSEGTQIFEMFQPISFFNPTFTVRNTEGRILCMLKSKSCRLTPLIEVLDERNQVIGNIAGDWRFTNFSFTDLGGKAIAKIDHCFGGLLREALTSSDDYDVEMLAEAPDPSLAMVTLAAAIAIDVWFHK